VSGYCADCGNTLCICPVPDAPPSARRYGLAEIKRQVRQGYHPGSTIELLETVDAVTYRAETAERLLAARDAELKALREALEKYGDHRSQNCAPMYGCHCGLSEALAAAQPGDGGA
jgi:hypothetical protein